MDGVFLLKVGGILSAFKLLMLNTYHSTDFDVHRNWLAITSSRNLSEWYYEDTSEWTLDYPPLFAYFQYGLSRIAQYFDPKMLQISKEPYSSDDTILFQKLSVIITDWLYLYAAYRLSRDVIRSGVPVTSENWKSHSGVGLLLLLTVNCGLFIVDHIHFQYNGFLFGVLLLSIVDMMTGHPLRGAFWFTCLLCLKHIFLYMAPAYVLELLRHYLFTANNKDGSVDWRSLSIKRIFLLALVKFPVYLISFGPFLYMNQFGQVVSRLFPFKRGLSHAYWAPNFWSLYNFADKSLAVIGSRLGLWSGVGVASMTGGLVQEYEHSVLPSVSPLTTMVLTLLTILPVLYMTWSHPCGNLGHLRPLVLCAFTSFMFGWHVHEKAILMVTIPLSISAMMNKKEARILQFLAPIGHFSLFPLIFTTKEIPIVLLSFLIHSVLVFVFLGNVHRAKSSFYSLLSLPELLYLLCSPLVYLYWLIGHQYTGLSVRYPFLPLMMISVYCAAGVAYSYVRLYLLCMETQSKTQSSKKKEH